MKERKCRCAEFLTTKVIYIHLLGCPEDGYTQEYAQMSWWKKLWNPTPETLYAEFFKP